MLLGGNPPPVMYLSISSNGLKSHAVMLPRSISPSFENLFFTKIHGIFSLPKKHKTPFPIPSIPSLPGESGWNENPEIVPKEPINDEVFFYLFLHEYVYFRHTLRQSLQLFFPAPSSYPLSTTPPLTVPHQIAF